MAESVITFVVQSLSNLLVQKAEFFKGVHGQVGWLRDELQRMQCFLKDADAKQDEDQGVRNWVTEIRTAAYDAEDIVDIFILKMESQRRHGFIKRYALIFKEVLNLRKVGNEIEAFRARISNISKSCETYGIKSIGEGTSSSTSRERLRQLRRSSPRGVDKDIIGMKKDVTQLVARLLKKENHLTVISLVGMGAKEEIFLEIHGKIEFPPSIKSRHQSIHSNFNPYFASKPSIPGLRSLLLFHPYDPTDSMKFLYLDTICGSFKLLRVLNLENMQIGYLQKEIGRLINLRYLDLKNTGINQLPSSMRYLKSLQTLDISGNVSLRKIPDMICKMENLRHLYMNALTCTGKLRIDSLENLQTLSWIHIDNWKVKNSGNLANLRKLGVAVYSGSDLNRFLNSIAELERLVSLQLVPVDTDIHLPSLSGISLLHSVTKLCLEGRIRMLPPPHEFPPNIAQLTLHKSFLCVNPMGVLKQLPKLSILRLRKQSYTENQMTIYAGGFPLLNSIELEGLEGLENLTIQDGAMPRLRQFRISSCRGIEYLPAGIMSATSLQELEICRMTSAFVSRLRGKDNYKVKHIPSITFS
ncbi:hypothetical protein LWI28_028559 [Acer negundo]|uniref:Rx N-terminal domain-containing protein n=1 Tax=Acer negundo TaxID=4023 RepID=A0AAD5NJ97_ACENE|nr:hypothetical protein LWI28_028559 [Acer negundo]